MSKLVNFATLVLLTLIFFAVIPSVTFYSESSFSNNNLHDNNNSTYFFDSKVFQDTENVHFNFSSYLGGSSGDVSNAISVNSNYSCLAGYTYSFDFPTKNAAINYSSGVQDAFVAEFSNNGSLIFSSYLGGNDNDWAFATALDSSGNCYVTGNTFSTNFPTKNAYNTSISGKSDIFVAKFNISGILIYSTYLGGYENDFPHDIIVDASGNVYITGQTESNNFPTINAYQKIYGGKLDVFVSKLNATGSLVYSTYLGGAEDDIGNSLGVDMLGNVYVTGSTNSSSFPVVNHNGVYKKGGSDIFLTCFNSSGGVLFSTLLGGSSSDSGVDIVVLRNGTSYILGYTGSSDFPIIFPFKDVTRNNPILAKFDPSGFLLFSTFIGYTSNLPAQALAVDKFGSVYFTGSTLTNNMFKLFIYEYNSTGNLIENWDVPASGDSYGAGIGVDESGSIYITGYTIATDFPVKNAFQSNFAGYGNFNSNGGDAIIMKVNLNGTVNGSLTTTIPVFQNTESSFTSTSYSIASNGGLEIAIAFLLIIIFGIFYINIRNNNNKKLLSSTMRTEIDIKTKIKTNCSSCGYPLAINDMYCSNCGEKVHF